MNSTNQLFLEVWSLKFKDFWVQCKSGYQSLYLLIQKSPKNRIFFSLRTQLSERPNFLVRNVIWKPKATERIQKILTESFYRWTGKNGEARLRKKLTVTVLVIEISFINPVLGTVVRRQQAWLQLGKYT